jgi:hypothetical protein
VYWRENATGESALHLFLKNVGKAFLYNQECHLVDTEVRLNQIGLKRFHELDNHTVIDVCGVGLKYSSHGKKSVQLQKAFQDFELVDVERYEFGYNILRGIEVKVSRSDFRNGFVCSGCNYHYLLTPMRLVAGYEVPKGVGLIEYNKYKFSCQLSEEDTFHLKGLRVIKRPSFRRIPQFQIDNVITNIASRSRKKCIEQAAEDIRNGINK